MKWLGVTVFCLVQAVKLLIALALTFPLAAQQVITKNQADDQIIIFLDQPAPQGGSLLADPEHPDRVRVNIGGLPYIGVNDAPVTMTSSPIFNARIAPSMLKRTTRFGTLLSILAKYDLSTGICLGYPLARLICGTGRQMR